MSHVYRAAPVHILCAKCRQPAVFCCPGCGTATCQEHTDFVDLCASCTLELNAAEHRAGGLGTTLIVILGAGGVVLLALLSAGLAVTLGLLTVIAAPLYRGLRQARARKAFGKRSGMFVLEGAVLPIARNVVEDEWRAAHRRTRERDDTPYFPTPLCGG
jgi:hypothetical protein